MRTAPSSVSATPIRASPAVTNLLTSPTTARPLRRIGASTWYVHSSGASVTGHAASAATRRAVPARQSHAMASPPRGALSPSSLSAVSPVVAVSPGLQRIVITYAQRPASWSLKHSATIRLGRIPAFASSERLVGVFKQLAPGADVQGVVDELIDRTEMELDYRLEADNQRAFAKAYHGHPHFKVPVIVASAPKVVIAEWMDGIPMSVIIREGTTEQRDLMGTRLFELTYDAPRRLEMMHGDAHPGNFMLLPGDRMGVIDFGAVAPLPGGIPEDIGLATRYALEDDYDNLQAAMQRIGFIQQGEQVSHREMDEMMKQYVEPLQVEVFHYTRKWLQKLTAADLKAEKIVRDELLKARPTYGFLGEESEEIKGTDGAHRWLVDPLDGTTNFLHGIPQFAISIGLQRDDTIIAGVIYNPANDELYIAERGKGAFLNDQRLRVAGRRKLSECVIACGLPHIGRGDHEQSRREMSAIQDKVAGLRRFGAASLDMAFVAAGRLDGYWERNLQAWDVAAGQIMVREAGGIVSGIGGHDDALTTGHVVCGNEFVQSELVKLLKPL